MIPEWLFQLQITEPERISFGNWSTHKIWLTYVHNNLLVIKDSKRIFTPNLGVPSALKTPERIPNRRDEDYFYLYEHAEFKPISWYRRLFSFISRCLYFITGPKFVVPILGMVQYIRKSTFWKSKWLHRCW